MPAKLSEWGHPDKIDKNPSLHLKVSSGDPKHSWIVPLFPQNATMEAPCLPIVWTDTYTETDIHKSTSEYTFPQRKRMTETSKKQ